MRGFSTLFTDHLFDVSLVCNTIFLNRVIGFRGSWDPKGALNHADFLYLENNAFLTVVDTCPTMVIKPITEDGKDFVPDSDQLQITCKRMVSGLLAALPQGMPPA